MSAAGTGVGSGAFIAYEFTASAPTMRIDLDGRDELGITSLRGLDGNSAIPGEINLVPGKDRGNVRTGGHLETNRQTGVRRSVQFKNVAIAAAKTVGSSCHSWRCAFGNASTIRSACCAKASPSAVHTRTAC